MKTRTHHTSIITLFTLLALVGSLVAAPLGTAFTYQGRLSDGANPANGIYDLRLTLYDAATNGSVVAGPLTNAAVAVSNGLFTTALDFGSGVFDGNARWLELGVRSNGSAADFTTLSPRQPLTPTPYALLAGTVPAGAIGSAQLAAGAVNASNIMSGTITAAQLAPGSAFSNLYAGGQSGVALGGVVMSEDPDNDYLLNAGYVRLGASSSLTVTPETWRNLASGPADSGQPMEGRGWHTAIWTGSEMIVWGGYNDGGTLNTGARYNPASDSWNAVSQVNAPSARLNHSAVWTGTQMIIWGGRDGFGNDGLNTGKRYNPTADTWSSMSAVNAPTGRYGHAAIWSGSVMVVWGGHADSYYWSDPAYYWSSDLARDGGRYNPTSDTWTTVRTNTAPSPRAQCAAVWTGSEMIIWGGYYESSYWQANWIVALHDEHVLNDGGRYNPASDTWSSVSTNGAPSGRYLNSTIWTGSRMVVWGGHDLNTFLGTGGRYDPSANTWTSVSTSGAPSARADHTAVWTGFQMVVWGGYDNSDLNSGGRYDPAANTWASTSATGVPAARSQHTAVWTGSRMLVWGGYVDLAAAHYPGLGGRYDPTNNAWTAMSTLPAGFEPGARQNATALWTGSEMIIWGGENNGQFLRSGARFNPAANSWTALSMTNAPAARSDHSAVWAGTEMLVWGGYNGQALGSGGRFNPALNTWSAISANGAPSARRAHTAVWTGDEMLVWGGYIRAGKQNNFFATGGRYAPGLDRWSNMSTNRDVQGRAGHTAVWTGTEMILWGGYYETGSIPSRITHLSSGARYWPALDLGPLSQPWGSTSTRNAPSERRAHTVVWTGEEMIVWGGYDGRTLSTGGRYLPSLNAWSEVSTNSAPTACQDHTAVWTGTHMLIWGGRTGSTEYNTGARYSPTTDKWWPITTTSAPAARYDHNAVWTGSEMLIWSGYDGINCLDTIKGYTPPVTLYLYLKP